MVLGRFWLALVKGLGVGPAPLGDLVTAHTTGLSGHRDFMKLWTAQTVSSFGARIAREGLPIAAVVALNGGPAALGLVAALRLGPQVLVGLVGGPIVDRLPRRPVLIGADVARALVLATFPIAALLHRLTLGQVYVAAILMGGLNVVFDMADHAYLPDLIDKSQLMEGNAKLGATDAVAEAGGPAIWGILFSVLSAPVAVGASAVTYVVSALCLSTIRARPRPREIGDPEPPPLFNVVAGVRACLAHPLVRPIFAAAVLRNFFGAFYAALYIIYALHVLGLSIFMLGLAVGCGGLGGLAGAVLAPAVTRRLGIGRTIVVTGLMAGAISFLTPLAGGAPIVALMFLVTAQLFGDGIETVTAISASSLRQSVLPGDLLGRAAGAFMASEGLAGVLGAIVGGLLGRGVGVRETLYFAAAGIAVAPLIGLFSPLWRVRTIGEDDRA